MPLVHALTRRGIDQITDDESRACGQIVRKHVELANQVERPDDVRVLVILVVY